jgi:hypothetical protein
MKKLQFGSSDLSKVMGTAASTVTSSDEYSAYRTVMSKCTVMSDKYSDEYSQYSGEYTRSNSSVWRFTNEYSEYSDVYSDEC